MTKKAASLFSVALWERRVKHCERYAYLRGLLNEQGQRDFESRHLN